MTHISVSGVKTVEILWIPLSDGRRLAARLFLPEDAERHPVPLVLEYIPYRRRDNTRTGDDEMHLFFAANGYACAHVDIAGTGDSDGSLEDEYVEREQDDALEVIDYLCTQGWCTGIAGMIGISWGGFSALQTAARRPPRLKTIVTACSTDDRYACDAHYNGGLLINDNFGWGGALFSYAALPPDPAIVGKDHWRALWRHRLENHSLFPATWLRHQRRDEFWKHGSICEDYGAIECPVLAVGGWLDGYTPTIFRLVERLSAVTKGICGPWGHKEPQNGFPGPAIGYLQECVRWFDRWLKDADNGVDRDPAMRLWLMNDENPAPDLKERPGRWLGFPRWPSPDIAEQRFFLDGLSLSQVRSSQDNICRDVSAPMTVGIRGQEWCPFGQGRIAAEGALDQREDDALSLCFDSQPQTADLALVGVARLVLKVAADKPQAMVAARLTSVAPDGTSALMSFGLLNLSHRDSHEVPQPMTPGKFETVELALKPIGQIIPKGHRVRLAISPSYWPLAWPSPEPVTLTIDGSGSYVALPILSGEGGLVAVAFDPPLSAQPGPVTVKEPARQLRTIGLDVATERTTLSVLSDDGRYVIEETGTEMSSWRRKDYAISRHDPISCATTVACHEEYRRDDWHARVDCEISVRCDVQNFYITGWVKGYDRDALFLERSYDEVIPRDHL